MAEALEEILKLVNTERYELLQKTQNDRNVRVYMGTPEFGVAQSGGARHDVLYALVKALHRPIISVLEVGSFEGQSALVWNAAIALYCPEGGSVLCVDPWSSEYLEKYLGMGPAYVKMYDGLKDGTVYGRFCHNVALANPKVPIRHYRGKLSHFVDFCSRTDDDELFDIVYIDGDHCASAVLEDIELARPLVKVGGLICGDDLEAQGGGVDWDSTVEVCETTDYFGGRHPGVTVAVWTAFGQVWAQNGVWAVQKTGDDAWQPPGGV